MRPTFLMVPGWGMDTPVWGELCSYLSPYQIRFINWNHMDEVHEFEQRVIKAMAEEENVILIGWSLGALVALHVAQQEQVLGIVLLGGTARFTKAVDYPGWPASFVTRMKRGILTDKVKTLARFDTSMFTEQESIYYQTFSTLRARFQDYDVHSLLVGLSYLLERDMRDTLDAIQTPLLLLHGEADNVCPVAGAYYIQQKTGARLYVWPEVGHAPHITQARECADLIKQFAAEVT
ncbi:alpha/beta hydrolase [Ectobacillus antri]|jgi:pimeloyl-[acyl-carrier protein] methyl ester esterase|uniref:Alpha/beta hydrolase n=1 Tax=Ectobacillus antri TaxID=2486280 RepID=A0ABT6H1Y4_9BACI|nr:alpha/beta hydrolase [Ectobacillus antri]MDG4655663.1 alpha/beta hydrolase [Ectobacillus antri]MDG5753421.1 alpha/beta hydrolase [Ectobacillus antri]